MKETIITLIAAGMTLALFSYLWRENRAYRIAEHLYIGVAAGYGFVYSMDAIRRIVEKPLSEGRYEWYIPIILGLLFLFYFSRKYFWVYRYPMAITVGAGIGVSLVYMLKTRFIEQIRYTIVPLVTGDPMTTFNNIVLVFGVATALSYFFASAEHKGVLGVSARIGRYVLMIAFGASFGVTVMARISLLIGRLQFLFFTEPAYYMIPVAIALLAYAIYREHMQKKK